MEKRIVIVGILAMAAVQAGCKKHNEIPTSWFGRYRRTAAFGLVADQFVVVGPNTLTVQNCQFNCGEPVLQLQNLNCTGVTGNETCRYTSEHCTGTISVGSDRLSVTATPTPTTATGPALGTHNQTCFNVRVGMGTRAP